MISVSLEIYTRGGSKSQGLIDFFCIVILVQESMAYILPALSLQFKKDLMVLIRLITLNRSDHKG